ncbi:MAG: hypothetical protein AAGI25_13720 [Bacteroidota bacterium]
MNIQSHKRILGILHIVYGSLTALLFVFIGVIISSFLPFIIEAIVEDEGPETAMIFEMVASVIRTVVTFIFILSAVPSLIGGIGLVQGKNWGLTLCFIAGCISIFSFPFGTALGVYSLYVFIEDNKQRKNDQNQK